MAHPGGLDAQGTSLTDRWVKKFAVIEEVASKWKPVNLSALQKLLPSESTEVQAQRELLSEGRKTVSTKTKDFAKLPTEEKVGQVGSILKTYQGYIDELSKSLKHVQDLYLELNAVVAGLQDPVPLLSRLAGDRQAVLNMCGATEELEKVKRALAEREGELKELRNQEVTIQQLREELADAEMRRVSTQQEHTAKETAEIEQIVRQYQQREFAFHEEINQLSQECRKHQIVAVDYSNQLATARSKLEEVQTTKDKEMEQLYAELDQLNLNLAVAERSRARLQSAQEGVVEGHKANVEHLEAEVYRLQRELEDVQAKASLLRSERDKLVQAAGRQMQSASGPTQHSPITPADPSTASMAQEWNLEKATLNGRIQDLEQQLESARAQIHGHQTEVTVLRNELAASRDKEKELKKENVALEKELRQLMLVDASRSSLNDSAPKRRQPFDLSTVVGTKGDGLLDSNAGGEASTPDPTASALETMMAQRDRYRQRLLALEESSMQERDALKLQLFSLKQENEQLQFYLRNGSSLGGGSSMSAGPSGSAGTFSLRIPGASNALVIRTSLLDRFALLLTRFIVANEYTRRFFLLYILGLHSFVFLVLTTSMAKRK